MSIKDLELCLFARFSITPTLVNILENNYLQETACLATGFTKIRKKKKQRIADIHVIIQRDNARFEKRYAANKSPTRLHRSTVKPAVSAENR